MMALNQFLQPFIKNVGIDLGGRYVRVSEQLLDDPQIRTILQNVACKGMTQDVR